MSEEQPGPYLGGGLEKTVHRFPDSFADADESFDSARFVVLGLPYGRTVSYRFGTERGPEAIRQATWNNESFNIRNRVDLRDVPMHDMGDVAITDLEPDAMFDAVKKAASEVARAGKFLLALGGEHSTSPPLVHALAEEYEDLAVLQLDAHLDYRRDYEGSINNHACAIRRMVDAVGPDKVCGIGIRSVEKAELEDAEKDGYKFFTAFDVRRRGMGPVLHEALAHLDAKHVYVTLDIDGLDPAYAPGTGTPEPFGLTPWDVLDAISQTAPKLVGFDINEVSPAWDDGTTASLAARLAREVVTEVWAQQRK